MVWVSWVGRSVSKVFLVEVICEWNFKGMMDLIRFWWGRSILGKGCNVMEV